MKPPRSRYTWKDYLRIGAGVVMFILGLIGLVFPILQGVLFLIIAAALLAPYSVTIRRLQAWSERRFPSSHERAHALRERLGKRFNRRRDGARGRNGTRRRDGT